MRYADMPTVEETVHVKAPPERVWALVTDMDLIAEISTELQAATWLDDGGPRVGARLHGVNRHPEVGEWETVSYVVACDPPREFAWVVHDRENPAATWRFTLVPREGGTDLTQWAQLGPGPSGLTPAIERWPDKEDRIVAGRLAEWLAGIECNLAAFRERAEAGPPER